MNKNLKKVISAAAALTLSASSFAAFAVNFPDVESTANYSAAVAELSALDIISGYEDGTFKPDNLVTRAEITKMIVDARKDPATGSNVKFADSQGHWAASYITAGVNAGFISGHSDTVFAPDDNVTYVQAQKMLVAAVGYDTYAQAQGGWPGGYKMFASSLGITDGVSANDDDQLTRAQVAQMIDNAMDTPLCIIEKYEPSLIGAPQPVYEVKNGEGKDYQTLFTEKHKAYKVFGRVTDTSKTGNVDTDKVTFNVEKADNFDKTYVKSTAAYPAQSMDMYFGDTNAESLLRTYSEALVQKDNNDEFTILSITPAAANKSVTLAAENLDDRKSTSSVLWFYPENGRTSQKYQLADNYTVFVNGVKVTDANFDLVSYIDTNDTAAVTLQKETQTGSTNSVSDYNIVMINSYVTAVVEDVIEKSSEIQITFKVASNNVPGRMIIQTDNDDFTYSFTMNGSSIEPTELEEFDVLNIAADANFRDSSFYDVIVTRDVVESAKCTGINASANPKEYTIGGTKYKAAAGMEDAIDDIEMSGVYSVYLDHFGRLAYVDENTVDKKYGILKNIFKRAGGSNYAQIITKEGEEIEYKIDDDNVESYKDYLKAGWADNETQYNDTDKTKLAMYPQQVVEYSVSSSTGKVTIKGDALTGTTIPAAREEYRASSDKIGSVRLSDSSVILDISAADSKDEVKVVSKDSLVDGNTYLVTGFDKAKDGTHRLVLLLSGTGNYNPDTQLAIYNSEELVTPEGSDDNRTAFNVIIDGEEKQYLLDEDYESSAPTLNEGDPIVFMMNSVEEITDIKTLFKSTNLMNGGSYDAVYETVVKNKDTLLPAADKVANIEKELSDSKDKVELVFGPVVNRSGSLVTIGTVADYTRTVDGNTVTYQGVDYEAGREITIPAESTKIYTFNFGAPTKDASRVLLGEGIAATPKTKAATYEVNGNDVLDLTDSAVADSVVFALARVIDDEAQEMYLIVRE